MKRLAARLILAVIGIALGVLLWSGLVEIAGDLGVGVALAIMPGIPIAVLVLRRFRVEGGVRSAIRRRKNRPPPPEKNLTP